MPVRRVARGGESLELRRIRNGKIGWTAETSAGQIPARHFWDSRDSKDARLSGSVGLTPNVEPPPLPTCFQNNSANVGSALSKYGGLYKEWIPLLRHRLRSWRGRIGSLLPRRVPPGVSVPEGLSLRIVRASTFVRHLCELCGSDVVKATRVEVAGRACEAIRLDDGGQLLLQELDEGTCVEVVGRAQNVPASSPAAESESPESMKVSVKERQ